MRKTSFLAFFLLIMLVTQVFGQSIIPVNIQRSVKKGFRTTNGVPGENYFQNWSNYIIRARFDPKHGNLSGDADITYYNNSPDTLRKMVFRLYQNIARKGGIRDSEWDADNIHKGVRISKLIINKTSLTDNLTHRTRSEGTNFTVYLPRPLSPDDSVFIEIGWNFDMPGTAVHRYGKYGAGTYFVSLWYPQIAVYDDIDGWDEMNYTGTHEFYNDFNNYDVSIKVPAGFMVWASGQWINAGQIMQPEIVKRWEKAGTTDQIVHILQESDLEDHRYLVRKGSNTFHFKANALPDFAFGISDSYLWDAASVIVDSVSDRRVIVSAAYEPGANFFDSVAVFGTNVIRHFNYMSYNFPFPYNQITVFNGDGGMEYPMIVNNGTAYSKPATLFVTMHEIAHSYFPFLTGINERKYSWVDEGLTTYLPIETEKAMHSDYYPIERIVYSYCAAAGTENDIPLSVPAYQTRERPYQYYTYMRSSIAFHMLELYMGRQYFRNGIRDFIQTWQYKHPTPYDMFAILKRNTIQDIDWFIDQWFFQNGWPDLSVGKVEQVNDSISIEINCDGNYAVPVMLTIVKENGISDTIHLSPEIWKTTKNYIFSKKTETKITEIRVGDDTIPDITPENNIFKLE